MSVKMMSLVFERFPFGGNERVLALALADNANEFGEHIYPGNELLAKKCLMSERTVIRMLQKFIEIGWLEKVKQGNKRLKQANEYRISELWVLGGVLNLLGDNLSPNNSDDQVTNTPFLGDKNTSLGDKSALLGDIAVSPQRHIQHHNNVITTPRAKETPPESKPMRPEGALACRLIPQGVLVTSMHPTLCKWVADEIPIELIEQCLALARLQKPLPEKIAANYLDSIIRSELRPKKPDKSWVMSDEATLAHGNEIGLLPKVGESMADYKMRLKAA
jgi:hypothetical protein